MSDQAPDCGDNSCLFGGAGKGGMRTNGGCRCLRDLPPSARRYFARMHSENAELRKQLEHANIACEYWRLLAEKKVDTTSPASPPTFPSPPDNGSSNR